MTIMKVEIMRELFQKLHFSIGIIASKNNEWVVFEQVNLYTDKYRHSQSTQRFITKACLSYLKYRRHRQEPFCCFCLRKTLVISSF